MTSASCSMIAFGTGPLAGQRRRLGHGITRLLLVWPSWDDIVPECDSVVRASVGDACHAVRMDHPCSRMKASPRRRAPTPL